ncbi:MAG: tetratricopeptide repeat protein [Desulfobacteraceae bacterium]|nr:tetratricopeptide repeat protein [Desulfobacteraceae bacterium]
MRRLVSQSPNNAQAHNDIGVLYFEAGDKNKALSSYEQAVQLDPGNHMYQKNLASLYLIEQGHAQDAMNLYLRVLEDNPENIDALIASGMVCACLGKKEDAQYFYHRVLEIEPWNQTAQTVLGDLKFNKEGDDNTKSNTVAAG